MCGFGRRQWWYISNYYFSISFEVRKITIMVTGYSIKSVAGYLLIGSPEHWLCNKPLHIE
jgi:hypothetical protein